MRYFKLFAYLLMLAPTSALGQLNELINDRLALIGQSPQIEMTGISDPVPVNNNWIQIYRTEPIVGVGDVVMNSVRESLGSSLEDHQPTMGGWSGGGGEGIACFSETKNGRPSEAIAQRALDHSGRIKSEYREKIVSLWSSDSWEYADQLIYELPQTGENADEYLTRIVFDRLMPIAPYFAQRLLEAAKLLNPAPAAKIWNPSQSGSLIKINDAGPRVREIPKGCRAVQLVVRYSRSTGKKYPEVFIDYDKDLYDKFIELSPNSQDGVAFQAALRLHEILYAVGTEIGMSDSSTTRALTAHLLSASLWDEIALYPPRDRMKVLTGAIYQLGFRKFSLVFMAPSQVAREPFSKSSRQAARASLATKYEETYEQFSKEQMGVGPIDNSTITLSQEYKFFEKLSEVITSEEAFLFMAANEYNAGRFNYNTDVFLSDLVIDTTATEAFCSLLDRRIEESAKSANAPETIIMLNLYTKAKAYCQGL